MSFESGLHKPLLAESSDKEPTRTVGQPLAQHSKTQPDFRESSEKALPSLPHVLPNQISIGPSFSGSRG